MALIDIILQVLIPVFIGVIIGVPIALIYLNRKFKKIEKNIPKELQVEDKVPTPQFKEQEGGEIECQNKNKLNQKKTKEEKKVRKKKNLTKKLKKKNRDEETHTKTLE